MNESTSKMMWRFTLPVMLSDTLTVVATIIFSALCGGISQSSLPAVSTANLLITFLLAAFNIFTTGSAVLMARSVGARDYKGASHTIEQTIMLTTLVSLTIMAIVEIFAPFVMRLLMPTADNNLMGEAITYIRIVMISFPLHMLYAVLCAVIRAAGDSKAPLVVTAILNISFLVLAVLFISVFSLGVIGAGIAMALSRIIAGAISLIILFKSDYPFEINMHRLIKPHTDTIKRIVHVGMPVTIEQSFIQMGYLIANSMVVSLGNVQATVYQIATSLQTFPAIVHTVSLALTTTMVGQKLGAGDKDGAFKVPINVTHVAEPICLGLSLVEAVFATQLASMYSSVPEVISGNILPMWILVLFAFPCILLNIIDPALRAGGDVKWVMTQTMFGVWVVRLPLSFLSLKLGLGASGLFAANLISLTVRALVGFFRFRSRKWMDKKV